MTFREIVEYMSFPFKADLNIKETAGNISENYSTGHLLKGDINTTKQHFSQDACWMHG